MGNQKFTDFFIYKHRYFLSQLLLWLVLAYLLTIAALVVPNGLSASEMQNAVTSYNSTPDTFAGSHPNDLLHLPYHLLQNASLRIFGVTNIGIKLPSLLLTAVSVFFLYRLLRLWFRRNVAILTSVILMTSGQFLLQAQLGTPDVGYLFWNAALLFGTSMLTQEGRFQRFWLIMVAVVAALSLYSPHEIYVVIALLATSLFHPHARFIVFRQPLWLLVLSAVFFFLLLLPLILGIVATPSLLPSYFGIAPGVDVLTWNHANDLFLQYFGFFSPSAGEYVRPIYGLGIVLLMALGLFRLFTAKYTAKSYIISFWMLFTIPVVILQSSAVSFTFVLSVVLVAFAIDYLIRSWYGLFPHNPYARVVGFVPLSVLVVGILLSGADRFMSGYHYTAGISNAYVRDLSLVKKAVSDQKGRSTTLLVTEKDVGFYAMYADSTKNHSIHVTDNLPEAAQLSNSGSVTIASSAFKQTIMAIPSTVIASTNAENADRFYLYKNSIY